MINWNSKDVKLKWVVGMGEVYFINVTIKDLDFKKLLYTHFFTCYCLQEHFYQIFKILFAK